MDKRNENLLNDLLKVVSEEGFASVKKWLLLHWFGQTNMTVAVRRDLRERWKAMMDESNSKGSLRLGECEGNILLANSEVFFPKED